MHNGLLKYYDNEKKNDFEIVVNDSVVIKYSDINSYWYRRGDFSFNFESIKEFEDFELNKVVNDYIGSESYILKDLLHKILKNKFSIGSVFNNSINKLENLLIAKEIGLITPKSLITNQKVLNAKQRGYTVTLLFFFLNNVELAKERVKTRVKEGGHNIPNDVIERRYFKGIKNLFDIYIEIVDGTLIFDNSYGKHELIAQIIDHEELVIVDSEKFNQLKKVMSNRDKQIELRDKIVKGLELVYERLIEFKKEKKSELVIMKGDKIVKIKP